MIVPMKRLNLIALREDEQAILRELQKLSALQVLSTDAASGSEELETLRREVERIGTARRSLKPYYKKSMLAPTLMCDAAELAKSRAGGNELCTKIEALQRELSVKRVEADRHIATAEALAPFMALTTPIEDIAPTKSIRYIAGVADEKALSRVRELPGILDTHIAIEEYPGQAGTGVLIGCFALDRDAILRSLKETTFSEYTFPSLTGTPAQAIAAQRGAADALILECEQLEESLRTLAKERLELDKAEDAAAIERDREENRCAIGKTDYAFVLDAWARADKLDEIQAAVSKITDAYHIETRDPSDEEIPPSVMKNGKLTEPYETIVEMYARPSYRGVDATPALAPFYFLFFGMMLSDTGYGLALVLGCYAFLKLVRPRGNTAKLVRVIGYGGISAMLCGPFIGTFFGMDWNKIFGTQGVFPLLLDPMVDVMQMMILSCVLGLLHMYVGIGIKMYTHFRAKDWQSAIFDQFSWMLLITGLVMFFAFPAIKTVSLVMTILGGGMLLLFAGRSQKNPIKRAAKGLGALYAITGYLSDILSYVRIFALGLVSGAMGMVFNLIGGLIYSALAGLGIPGIILGGILSAAVLGALHVFSLFINTLGAFAHTARLQFIEFFGKFYEADGIAFKPLSQSTKNVELRQDKAESKPA